MGIYDYSVKNAAGEDVSLSDFEGKVMIIVNTATGCGFTPHYNTAFPQMKKSDVNGENELPLYTYLKSQKGFEGLPKGKHSMVLKLMFGKNDKNWEKNPDIKWNFTKFVVNRQGEVVARFEPTADMNDLEKCVASLI
ncbi:MAG: glutathione peroxidase [Firmicutes bacterium]|nr:glutathione peroxidase [Bacillota bacterium]